jgi:hypothetical protein
MNFITEAILNVITLGYCNTMKRIPLTLTVALITASATPFVYANDVTTANNTATAAKNWDRILPFFGERAVMNGHDLPLLFGISVIYADAQQDMTKTDLSIGFEDSKEFDLDFISFDNTISHTQTPQLKLDAWVLPFMNVFATFGKVVGTANINFAIDGNKALKQMGIKCPSANNKAICENLTDQRFEIDEVEAGISGMSYSTGLVLIGGLNSYFMLLPIVLSWTDMERNDSDSYTVNISPRLGKKFTFNNGTNLSLYTGVSYLNSQQTLSGSQTMGEAGESFNYTISQENIDKWMGVVGDSYSVTKHWSLAFEYGGFDGGNRRQFVSNLTYRY